MKLPFNNFLQIMIHIHSMTFISLFTFLAAASLLLFLSTHRRRRNPPLPPGPRGIPVLGNLPFLKPQLHTHFTQLGQKYGPIVKLQLGNKTCIVINSATVARQVLKDHDVTFANRDATIAGRASSYGGRDILWSPYGSEWRMLRKLSMVKMLGTAAVDGGREIRRREVKNAVRYIYGKIGSPVDVGERGFVTIMNVITAMMWGGTVAEEEGKMRETAAEIIDLVMKPNVSDFFPKLARFDFQGIEKKIRVNFQRFDEFFDKLIDRRLETIEKMGDGFGENDFLQFLLEQLNHGGDPKMPFTINHLKSLLMDMLFGGTDAPSSAIEFAMAEMIKNPQIHAKAQQELATVVGQENMVEEFHVQNLPYLQAILKETLRLHPTLPLLAPHSPSQSVAIAGYTIPKGSLVLINAWAIHRDLSSWESPLEFKPERFLIDRSVQWDYSGNDSSYIPFGSGRRMCAGVVLAERMALHLLAVMVHLFEWKLKEGEEIDVLDKFGTVLKKNTPLLAIPTPRLPNLSLYI